MTVGIPLVMRPRPWGAHDVGRNFPGAYRATYVDGELPDQDIPSVVRSGWTRIGRISGLSARCPLL